MSHSKTVAHVTTIDLSLRLLLFNQLQFIKQKGFDIVGISSHGEDVPYLVNNGIPHIPVKMSRKMTPLQDLYSLWKLYRTFKREKVSIVHTHNPKPGLIGQLAARMAGVPLVVNTLHGFYFHDETPPYLRKFYILTEKIAARCSDVILSQNKEDIEVAVQEGICKPELIQWLGNGIDITRFDRTQISEADRRKLSSELQLDLDRPVIGFVGRLVAEKGILELLAAVEKIKHTHPQIQLLIIGPYDSEKADALTPAVAQQYGLQNHCIFTGRREDMPELYSLMDIFVLPSHREGFPRSPMEASAMAVPSIVTNIRGCREAVKDGVNGLLCQLKSPDDLSKTITRLLDNQELRNKLGNQARLLAVSEFDERLVFNRVVECYERLLQK